LFRVQADLFQDVLAHHFLAIERRPGPACRRLVLARFWLLSLRVDGSVLLLVLAARRLRLIARGPTRVLANVTLPLGTPFSALLGRSLAAYFGQIGPFAPHPGGSRAAPLPGRNTGDGGGNNQCGQ